jgi:archaellum biogenesis ATPase FlaH
MAETKHPAEKEFESVSSKSLVLLETRAGNHFDAVTDVLAVMLNKNMKGVYVTVNRPSRYIISKMHKRSVDTDNVRFIDCISAMAGDCENVECTYVETPAALEDIVNQSCSLLERIKSEDKFFIIDSLSALFIYNGLTFVRDFSLFLIKKLREKEVNGILVIIESEVPDDIKKLLTEMCDNSIYI